MKNLDEIIKPESTLHIMGLIEEYAYRKESKMHDKIENSIVALRTDLETLKARITELETENLELKTESVNQGELYLEKDIQLKHADEKVADVLAKIAELEKEVKIRDRAGKMSAGSCYDTFVIYARAEIEKE